MGSKILIVDDDSALLDNLRYNLLKENYTVVTAVDGLKDPGLGHLRLSREVLSRKWTGKGLMVYSKPG